IEPRPGHVVIAIRHGELTVKRLKVHAGKLLLAPENPHFSEIELKDGEEWSIWGVATRVLHKL
ncbi:MAG: LexA family protein, partial [Rhodanobacteraceae bacterium]